MRFSVRQADVCAGEERRILRKSAFCNRCLTEKRALRLRRYGKPQSATLRCDGDSLLDHCRHGQLQFNSKMSFRPSCTAAPQPTPPVFGSAYSTNPRLPKRAGFLPLWIPPHLGLVRVEGAVHLTVCLIRAVYSEHPSPRGLSSQTSTTQTPRLTTGALYRLP